MNLNILGGIFLVFLSTVPLTAQSEDHFMTIQDSHQLQEAFSNLKDGAVIFIDVDDTLIMPKSKVFRAQSPYRFLIDELKKNRNQFPNFEIILSHWRLQRKSMLILKEWPQIIDTLKKAHSVYGLTKMETGPFGDIPSMEQWRYKELSHHGISFTPSFKGSSEETFRIDSSKPSPIAFYHGIFITGSSTKGDVLHIFLETEKPSQVVLVDDCEDHLLSTKEACENQGIPFLGLLFKGAELILGTPDPKVAEFQRNHLLVHAEWIEDEKAEQLINTP